MEVSSTLDNCASEEIVSSYMDPLIQISVLLHVAECSERYIEFHHLLSRKCTSMVMNAQVRHQPAFLPLWPCSIRQLRQHTNSWAPGENHFVANLCLSTFHSFQAPQFSPDPPGSYEAISFPGRRSAETEPGLQSVGLVAEACRDYERREPVNNRAGEPRQSVTRQNSSGSLGGPARLPPPYQSPPGPPPPYQPPPLNATTSPQRQGSKQPSPQVTFTHMALKPYISFTFPQHSNMLPNTRGFPDSVPQEPMTSTPKRPQPPGPRYPAPPPYPTGPRPDLGPRITAPLSRQPQGKSMR